MFHTIPQPIKERMLFLESLGKKQKQRETPPQDRLRQIPPETGEFIALLAASAPDGICLEIGTSGGYSALWLALTCRQRNRKLITFEILEEKVRLAQETFRMARVEDTIELIHGDAREFLDNYKNVSFCFLDAEKEVYAECYEKLIPTMVSGGILVADNIISHHEILQPMVDRVLDDERVDALVVPIGNGELVCRKL
ncbi:methyltransferase [candidate division TA06 bacterium DG_78]|uniref:Methyltransferase n=1 Tax=candidate division TA06 bacterium DG_78 TaxID=1703772 RepID=A0A0S7YFM1_UNCT6|nr:MAG: methyltransferase [candidate division TA06 bacterium DG_78]